MLRLGLATNNKNNDFQWSKKKNFNSKEAKVWRLLTFGQ